MLGMNYIKQDNSILFETLENNDIINVQNYIPIYQNFFSLSSHNYNKINLNHKFHLESIEKSTEKNKYDCKINDGENIYIKKSFFKFSPLLDPIKFMVGKYQKLEPDILSALPQLDNNVCHKKVLHINNTAYVDSFFSYLSSKVLHKHNFYNAIDFYGSFLCIKKIFSVNIFDDLDYLTDSNFFIEECNKLFKIENVENFMYNNSTRSNIKKLQINKNEKIILNLDEIKMEEFDGLFKEICVSPSKNNSSADIVFEYNTKATAETRSLKSDSSECSSNSSHTSHENSDFESDESDAEEDEGDEEDEEDEDEDEEEELVEAKLFNFPIQIIALESLDGTLDSCLENEKGLSNDQWKSCLFQIIVSLIIYQDMFDFTHNDLHTNNIMYMKTEKQYLYYKYDNIHYKIPTYGKIWKIIDFGRAIYKFKGKRICSDSFHKNGDAATQYNCEPFLNNKKPRLEPNKSFDLCRLGCSLFDYFIDDSTENKSKYDEITKLIDQWCKDDKGRNILYKTNGDERYPEFKLYKMIARSVHNLTPHSQIKNSLFKKFITSKKKINKKKNILNVDLLPSYIN
jgi:hypothetical protein